MLVLSAKCNVCQSPSASIPIPIPISGLILGNGAHYAMFYPPPLDVRDHGMMVLASHWSLSLNSASDWLGVTTVPSSVSALLYPINIVIMLNILTIVFLKVKVFLDCIFSRCEF